MAKDTRGGKRVSLVGSLSTSVASKKVTRINIKPNEARVMWQAINTIKEIQQKTGQPVMSEQRLQDLRNKIYYQENWLALDQKDLGVIESGIDVLRLQGTNKDYNSVYKKLGRIYNQYN